VPALALAGDPVVALRLAGVVAVTATASLLHALARRLGNGSGPALAAGLIYTAYSTIPGGRIGPWRLRGLAALFALGAGAPSRGVGAGYWAAGDGEELAELRRRLVGAVPALGPLMLATIPAWRERAVRLLLPRLAEGIGLRGEDPVRATARAAAAALRPGDALFVANWHAATYALAGVPPPTRLAFPAHLSGRDTALAGIDTQAELLRVLALPPGVIVVDPGRWGPIRAEARAAIEAALARDSLLAATIRDGPGPVEVWRHR
jgi:hypothetical protein